MKDRELQKRLIFGIGALAVFLPLLYVGGLVFQLLIGSLAMLGVYELMKMKGLEVFTIEGVLSLLAALVLTLPLTSYLPFLPTDANYTLYGLLVLILLGATVVGGDYSFEDAAYPLAASFYVGFGFHALIAARQVGFDRVLLGLLIVWATDSGAYFIGKQFGKNKLMPTISPNKTIEGSLGGVVSALVVSLLFLMVDARVANGHNVLVFMFAVVFFSLAGQFGDLVESSVKRHFGVKDSGRFIPGHGGVLDRFDSLLFVFPLMHLFGLF